MPSKIQIRRGTSEEWVSANPILSDGELGIETGTNLIKVGNGSAAWNDLGYFADLSQKADLVHYHALDALTDSGASEGDVPSWNGSNWVPVTPGGGGATETHFFHQIPKFPESLNYYVQDLDHFNYQTGAYGSSSSGTGAFAGPVNYDYGGSGADTTKKATGVFALSSGTATGWAYLSIGQASGNSGTMYLGAHEIRMGIRANLSGAIADGEKTWFGLWSHFWNIDPTDGVFFKHVNTENGNRWQAVAINADTSSSTIVDVGEFPEAGTYVLLEIVINRAGTEANYYFNGALVATITTSLPTVRNLVSGALRRKASGSSASSLVIDAIYHANEKLGAR